MIGKIMDFDEVSTNINALIIKTTMQKYIGQRYRLLYILIYNYVLQLIAKAPEIAPKLFI